MKGPARLGMITYGSAAGTIDLGNEPPLLLGEDDKKAKTPIRRAVSWRWLTGTVLTGVTSIALMGAALMAALNNPNQFASLPESFSRAIQDSAAMVFGQKGDRVRPLKEAVASRQIIQVSTVTRQGERDFIKLRPFAKIDATLTADEKALAQVPAYDAIRIFADTSAPDPATMPVAGNDQIYGGKLDTEVSVKVSAFPIDNPDLEPAASFDTAQVEQIVRAAARITPDVAANAAGLPPASADGSGDTALTELGVRIVPENVSNVAKGDADDGMNEIILAVTRPTDIGSLLRDNGIAGDDAGRMADALAQMIDVGHMRTGQKIRIAFTAPTATNPVQRQIRVSVYEGGVHQATVARADNNKFVRGDEPNSTIAYFDTAQPALSAGGLPTIYQAVYATAVAQQMPKPLVDSLIRMFAYDVDFQGHIGAGDSLEVLHSLPDSADKDVGDPEVLYAALELSGTTKRLYRYRTPDDGIVDYYDEDGRSAKKFLIRKPVPDGRITSSFGWRRHPILGRAILHAGVDYGSARGTPILAAGNGIVEKAGRSSGYGNLIVLRHTNGYETFYGHQSRFANGIAPGTRVRQGQIICYVGSTGLSTGNHLHFEIRINNKPVDPLRIRLPRGRVLGGEYLQAFEKERERIDTLLGNQPSAPGTKVASAAN
ncbi:M23 family metallopeptidase [soil metagenome]